MKEEEKNYDHEKLPDGIESVIAGSRIKWDRSREQIWSELEKRIESKPSSIAQRPSVRLWPRLAIAAGLAAIVGLAALAEFYTRTIEVPSGRHAEIYLPDKSVVKINAQSTLSYKPFSWILSRTLKFEGEAYFEVQKGKQFEVISGRGRTVVLGTSFNIYSRDDEYQVICITGKVKVFTGSGDREIILNPGQQTSLNDRGSFDVETRTDAKETISWVDNKFSFTSVPLKKVFEEIARQYGIHIEIPAELENTYTGTFLKDNSAVNVLNLVCRPFDLEVVQKSENEYVVTRVSQEENR